MEGEGEGAGVTSKARSWTDWLMLSFAGLFSATHFRAPLRSGDGGKGKKREAKYGESDEGVKWARETPPRKPCSLGVLVWASICR